MSSAVNKATTSLAKIEFSVLRHSLRGFHEKMTPIRGEILPGKANTFGEKCYQRAHLAAAFSVLFEEFWTFQFFIGEPDATNKICLH